MLDNVSLSLRSRFRSARIIAFFAERFQKKPILTWNAIAGVMQHASLDNSEALADLDYRPMSFRDGLQKAYPI
jgi:hypothetical protein